MTPDEIEDECLDNNHAVGITVIEDRPYAVLCSECRRKIEMMRKCSDCGEKGALYYAGGQIDSYKYCLECWVNNSEEPVTALLAKLSDEVEGLEMPLLDYIDGYDMSERDGYAKAKSEVLALLEKAGE